jgi:hypothetical protein
MLCVASSYFTFGINANAIALGAASKSTLFFWVVYDPNNIAY